MGVCHVGGRGGQPACVVWVGWAGQGGLVQVPGSSKFGLSALHRVSLRTLDAHLV